MNEHMVGRAAHRPGSRRALVLLAAAGVLTAAAMLVHPSGSAPAEGPVSAAGAIVGEHSALGDRRVDALNAAIAAMERVRGEHAGISRAEYQADAALDAVGP